MILKEKNGIYLIVCEAGESFWGYQVVTPGEKFTPKLRPVLKDWWDETAPGEWTTHFIESRKVICIKDSALFMLFKLAWSGREEIMDFSKSKDFAAYYCPYIPLRK